VVAGRLGLAQRTLFGRNGWRLVVLVDDLVELRLYDVELSLGGPDVLQLLTSLAVGLLDAGQCVFGFLSEVADLLARIAQQQQHLHHRPRSNVTSFGWWLL